MDLERIRRRVRRFGERAREARPQGADHGGRDRTGGERGGDPLAARRLAVGPSDAAYPEVIRGAAVELVGKATGPGLEVAYAHIGNAPLASPGKSFALPKDRRCAAADRLGDVAASVGLFPRVGEKCDARHATPAVR